MRLRWGLATDTGRLRQQNEDAAHAGPGIFVVADGMGGHNAGEVASAIAVGALREAYPTRAADAAAFVAEVESINAAIHRSAAADRDQRGMGTTLAALAVVPAPSPDGDRAATLADGAAAVVANVGDSRTYLLRDGDLRQVSVDHSYVQELLSEGLINADEARTHARRNIVTRALGIEDRVAVDSWTIPLVAGDRFVLCSDGLVDEVDDGEILATLRDERDPEGAAARLVAAANAHGGRDNVTVVVGDVGGTDGPAPARRRPGWRALAVAVGVASAVLIGGFAVLAAYARNGFFVGFESRDEDARVLVWRGRPGGVLWFGPTVEADSTLRRGDLDPGLAREIAGRPTFDDPIAARDYVNAIRDVVDATTTTVARRP
ncbi:MAG: protein phosphatase 2C domain-containing protein [Ilumatobacteraceae bacterium]